MKLYEILWASGFLMILFGGCCLDSPGRAYLTAVAVIFAGMGVTGLGILAGEPALRGRRERFLDFLGAWTAGILDAVSSVPAGRKGKPDCRNCAGRRRCSRAEQRGTPCRDYKK